MNLDQWAESCWQLLAVRARTLHVYKNHYANGISPVFGQQDLQSITRRQVQAWILSIAPVKGKYLLPVLKSLYREAINYDLTDVNPTVGIKRRAYQAPPREWLPWPALNAMDFGSYNDLFRFMACHGLRWSETQALVPADITDVIHVTKSTYGPTKNLQSRVVPYMGYYSDWPTAYAWARRRLQAVAGVSIHSLRYTYAHSLKTAGVHPQVAQRLMGHSTITLTFDLYTRVLPDELLDAGVQLQKLLQFAS